MHTKGNNEFILNLSGFRLAIKKNPVFLWFSSRFFVANPPRPLTTSRPEECVSRIYMKRDGREEAAKKESVEKFLLQFLVAVYFLLVLFPLEKI